MSARREWERLRKAVNALKAERERATQAGDTLRLQELEQEERELQQRFSDFGRALRPTWPSDS